MGYCRERGEEARTVADDTTDPDSKRRIFGLPMTMRSWQRAEKRLQKKQ